MEGLGGGHEQLRDNLAALWRRKWSILLITILTSGAAGFFGYQQTPEYRADARVLVRPLPEEGSSVRAVVNTETEVQILASQTVASRVVDDLQLPIEPGTLLDDLEARGIGATEVLEVAYTSTDPVFARDVANSFASNYIDFRSEETVNALTRAQQSIQSRIDSVLDEIDLLMDDIAEAAAAKNDTLAASLEAQRNVLTARLAVLQQSLDEVQPERVESLGGGQIIEEASVPSEPVSPKIPFLAALGAVLGLSAGLTFAYVRERLDDRVKGRMDLQRAIGTAIIGSIPKFRLPRKARGRPVVMAEPDSAAAEAYRALRTSVQFLGTTNEMKSFLVTSPLAGDGKTMTAVNLAVAAAMSGMRVVLVSADLRKPALDSFFDLAGARGLSEWLGSKGGDLWAVVHDPGIKNLRVVPSGKPLANAAEILASPRLGKLLSELEEHADLIVIDSPPTLAVADASILASHVDSTIVVVRAEEASRSIVVHAREVLARVGADIAGVVVNGAEPGSLYGGAYYGDYRGQAKRARRRASEDALASPDVAEDVWPRSAG